MCLVWLQARLICPLICRVRMPLYALRCVLRPTSSLGPSPTAKLAQFMDVRPTQLLVWPWETATAPGLPVAATAPTPEESNIAVDATWTLTPVPVKMHSFLENSCGEPDLTSFSSLGASSTSPSKLVYLSWSPSYPKPRLYVLL